jgi:YihY family inner membrane protein
MGLKEASFSESYYVLCSIFTFILLSILIVLRKIKNKMNLQAKARTVYRVADGRSHGVLSILVRTFQSFGENNAGEAAASIAYYALFSFFPLLVFLIGSVSSIFANEAVKQTVLDFVAQSQPTAQQLIQENIERALELQGPIQIAGTIGLLWAATGVFTVLAHNINRAWHTAKRRNFLLGRLIGIAMVVSLTGLLILWIIFTTAFNLLPLLEVPLLGSVLIYQTYAWSILSKLLPGALLFFTLVNLYRWVPNTKVRWREAFWGALVGTIGMELTTRGFSWYLTSGLARYQVVYGSLGVVVGWMLWLYLSSVTVLFGAHLGAAIAFHTRLKNK